MHYFPKPFTLWTFYCITIHILASLLQGIEIKFLRSTNQLFKLLWLKKLCHKFFFTYSIEPFLKGSQLALALFIEDVIDLQMNIFNPIFLCNHCIMTSWLQFKFKFFTKSLLLYYKIQAKSIL